ncbi:MAG: hypothetical protein PGN13_04825 [Patulibacter minatonensis]
MLPVRRTSPIAIAIAAAALAGAVPAASSAAAGTACKAGEISTARDAAGTTHTYVCDRAGAQLETDASPATAEQTAAARHKPEGGVSFGAASATPRPRCAIAGSKRTGRAGTTLVVIVRSTTRTGKTFQRTSTPFICGTDSAWRQVSSPFAGVTLIATSTVVTRTERA